MIGQCNTRGETGHRLSAIGCQEKSRERLSVRRGQEKVICPSQVKSGLAPRRARKTCTLPVGAIFTVSIPLTLTLNANQNQWVGLDFNLSKAITSTGGISVDFSQAGVLTATTTTRTGTPSGSVDTMEDFIGAVTVVSGTSVTVKSGISGVSLTAAINSNTATHIAPSTYSGTCSGAGTACVALGSIVSMDTMVSSSGAFTATEIDVLDDATVAAAVDEVEGVIYSVVGNSVGIVLADKTSSSGNSILAGAGTGTGIILDVSALNPTFSIDTKTLTTPLPAPTGFTGTGDLFAGQVIRAQVTNIASGGSGITASAKNVLLRFSRLSATIGTISGSSFVILNLPSYITVLNPGLGANPLVGTYLNFTVFDGVTATTDANFTGTVSIRALYLHNAQTPFQAAKVRVP